MSLPFGELNESELFSFFFTPSEDTSVLEPQIDLQLPTNESTTQMIEQQQQATSMVLDPIISLATADEYVPTEQIPPLFPSLEQLKLENDGYDDDFDDDEELEDCEFMQSQKKKKKKSTRSRAATKRKPSTRKNNKRATKKQKVEGETSFLASLRGLSSEELEKIAETRVLTPKEQHELKTFTRMIKNRESAQLSRERRKIYQETLERAFDVENARHSTLKQQILELEAENKVLKREFLQFKTLVEQSNLGKAFSSFSDDTAFKVMTKSAAAGDMQARATFAMYLMIVLHSFGQQLCAAGSTVPMQGAPLTAPPLEARAWVWNLYSLHLYQM